MELMAVPNPPRRFFLPDQQPWAVQQFIESHNEVLFRYGEYAIFFLLWQPEDFAAGLVGRCPVCFLPFGEEAETFQQPAIARCSSCLGTTFEGGFKARIVRPMVLDRFGEDHDQREARGQHQTAAADVQSTSDFRLRARDFFIRGDNSRWVADDVDNTYIASGFRTATIQRDVYGMAYGRCALQEQTSVIYQAEPRSAAEVSSLLDLSHPHYPADFSDFEIIRGDLIDRLPAPVTTSSSLTPPATWGDLVNYSWGQVSTATWGDLAP